MNLEQIDTSTTAGKARVMQLAAEGRRIACREEDISPEWYAVNESDWDWRTYDYAIIAEPVGPEEVWVPVNGRNTMAGYAYCGSRGAQEHASAMTSPGVAVRYIRADLAGEKG